MALPFRSELDEIKQEVEEALKKTEEKNDPKYAVKALKRAIDRAKRKNRIEERLRFSMDLLIVEYRYSTKKKSHKELLEAFERYLKALEERKDPKAEEYKEAYSILVALFEPKKTPKDSPERVKKFVEASKNYEEFLKYKHEFLDYARSTLNKTKASKLVEAGIIEQRLNEIEARLTPVVKSREEERHVYHISLPRGRSLTIRIREDAKLPEELRERLKEHGIDLSLV